MRVFHHFSMKKKHIKMFNSITLYNSRKKYFQFSHFPGKFPFLVKAKIAAILDHVTDP